VPRLLVPIVALLAGAILVPASGASAQQETQETGLGIRLLDAPVSLKDDPRAHQFIIDRVEQGSTIVRHVAVTNGTTKPMKPELYMAAAVIKDGAFTAQQPGARNEITSWGKIAPTTMSLAPGQSAQATVTITVPKDVPDGEYYGAAVASNVPSGAGVLIAGAVGIRVYLSVGKGAVKSDFELTKLTASRLDDGRPVVTAKVHNTGERALDMTGELNLSHGPGGTKAGPFPAQGGFTTLAIGDTQDVRVVLPKDTPKGPWKAVLTLRSGTLSHSVEGTITFPDIGERPEDIKFHDLERKKAFGAVAASLIILLLVIMVIVAWRYRKLRKAAAG
jgi:hypothetical protein